VLGLEEGSLPRRGAASPFLDDDARRALDDGARLQRPDGVSRDRYLFYTACTRPLERLYLVREAATDDGSPREPSPFWEETLAHFDPDDVRRWTRRRPLAALTGPVDGAPTERARLRALA
jgi:superfamily I DNA/RNA helicase